MIYPSPFPAIEIPVQPLTNFLFDHASEYPQKPALIDGPTGRTITYRATGRRYPAGRVQPGQTWLQEGRRLCHLHAQPARICRGLSCRGHAGRHQHHGQPALHGARTGAPADRLRRQLSADHSACSWTTAQAAAAEAGGIKEIFVLGEAEGATPFASLLKSDGQLPAVDDRSLRGSGRAALLQRHHRPAQGRHAHAPQPGLQHRQCENMPSLAPAWNSISDDVVLGLLPFYHIYGMVVIMSWALRRGATVVTMPSFDMEHVPDHCSRITRSPMPTWCRPSSWVWPNTRWSTSSISPTLRVIVSGAAPLSVELEDAVRGAPGRAASRRATA